MGDFGKALTRKFGPLPAWMYAVLIIGGAYLYSWWRKRQANGTTSTEVATDIAPADGSGDSTQASGYGINDASTGVGAGANTGGSTTAPDNSSPTSNLAWSTLATAYLVGIGYPATEVSQALNNWLDGLQASAQDNALFNLAVARYGQPPEGVPPQPIGSTVPSPGLPGGATQPPGTPAPKPGPKPVPKPPVTRTYYTVVSGDNLTAIAHKFGISEASLYANNKSAIEASARAHGHSSSNNGSLIFPGLKLFIK